jgi:DNA-binding LacI/PurR family transcriptional regulator
VPLVFMDEGPNQPHVAAVPVDYRNGIEEAVRHLAELGHKRIAFVSGPMQQCSAVLRREAFVDSMKKAGLRAYAGLQVESDHTLAGGVAAAEKLLAVKELPTAIVCSNDMMAVGVMRALSQHTPAIRVPEEISVIGFDDIQLAGLVHPPLTSVRLSRQDLARAAFDVLRAAVERKEATSRKPQVITTVTTKFMARESTGPAVEAEKAAPKKAAARTTVRKKEPAKATVSRAAASRTARR